MFSAFVFLFSFAFVQSVVDHSIFKCCPTGEIISSPPECVSAVKNDFSNITVYDYYMNALNRNFNDIFHVIPYKFNDTAFANQVYAADLIEKNVYLEQSGVLYIDMANEYNRWIAITDFCIDYMVPENGELHSEPQFWVNYSKNEEREKPTNILIAALSVSTIFLFLTLVVYHLIFYNKMTLVIKIRVCLIYSYISYFISMAIIIDVTPSGTECVILSFIAYFSVMATCCWLNVMSYDTWYTFRDLLSRNLTPSEKRRWDSHKYKRYVVYGWGVPLFMSIGMIVINSIDMSGLPWFITPQIPQCGCFLIGGQQFVYQYIPMMVFIFSNCLFFILTAFNISCMVVDSKALRASKGRQQKARLYICLRLSVTMGVSWIWEIISFLVPAADSVAIYLDLYNGFIGLLIFLIFICNKHTLSLVKQRYDVLRGRTTENISSQSDSRGLSMKALDSNSSRNNFSVYPRGNN
ncbi:probable G-protein coupled receptor Mth-like 1 [Zerene cesonia]|uniref:probable G-protein coupled receptor Mth-like 1 n=1 Tax=Zerene cesonia TaxID=33412 RepID=UPI0018E4FB78|nr:probable G-protein coupled receptor Mth-like 1 [Zerene cesonia]